MTDAIANAIVDKDLKQLSRGASLDMSSSAIMRRLEIVDELREPDPAPIPPRRGLNIWPSMGMQRMNTSTTCPRGRCRLGKDCRLLFWLRPELGRELR